MLSMKKLYNLLTLILVFALLAVAVPIAPVSAQSSTIVPFDFSTNLPSNWIIEGELGSGVTVTSGVTVGTDKALRFTIPSGTRRGFSASNISAPRALQPYESDTFDVTVKFLNTPGTEYAGILGIAVKGWYNTTGGLTYPGYLRFTVDTSDTPNDNTPYEPFASLYYFLDPDWAGIGMTDTTQDYPQLGDGPFWLRVRSEPGTAPDGTGDPVRYYRFWFAVEDPTQNSSNWIQIGMKSGSDYIRNFDVTHIGIVAGNTGDLPALTAYADYIIQTGSPIPNEDSGSALPATITASVSNPAGGSVSISPDGPYTAGQTVTATANVLTGYRLVNWTVNGTNIPSDGDNTLDVVLQAGENSIRANLALSQGEEATLTASVSIPAGGSISLSPPGPNYMAGQQVTATLTLNEGYVLTGWTFNGQPRQAGSQIQVTLEEGANTLVANVAPAQSGVVTLVASVNPSTGGTITVDPAGPYTAGQEVTATLSLNPGFELVSWTFNGEELPGGGDNVNVILADGANILTANVRPVDLGLPFSVYLPGIST